MKAIQIHLFRSQIDLAEFQRGFSFNCMFNDESKKNMTVKFNQHIAYSICIS